MLDDILNVVGGIADLVPDPKDGGKDGGIEERNNALVGVDSVVRELGCAESIALLEEVFAGHWIDVPNVVEWGGALLVPFGRPASAGGGQDEAPERYDGGLVIYPPASWELEHGGADPHEQRFVGLAVDGEPLTWTLTIQAAGGWFLRVVASELMLKLVPLPEGPVDPLTLFVEHPLSLIERATRVLGSLLEPYGEAAVLRKVNDPRWETLTPIYRLTSADGKGAPMEIIVPHDGGRIECSMATWAVFRPTDGSYDRGDADGLARLEAIVREVLRGRVTETVEWRGDREGRRTLVVGDPENPVLSTTTGGSWTDRLPRRNLRQVRTQFGPYAVPDGDGPAAEAGPGGAAG